MSPALSTAHKISPRRKGGTRPFLVRPASSLKGEIVLSGDKSIACRSIIISSISSGKTAVENFPSSGDCLCAIKVFKKFGVKIKQKKIRTDNASGLTVKVSGAGLQGLRKPAGPVFAGDSGTTLRLALGVLAGQDFKVKLIAGKSLSGRPMRRVTEPLRMMGAEIKSRIPHPASRIPEEYPPITIKGGTLNPITYKMPVASAQVKSAILLAGLYAPGKTCVIEPVITRDHTERMLKLFKADIKIKNKKIFVKGNKKLISPGKIYIPGDISSASFFMVLAAILPDSEIRIKNVGLNPARTGIIRVLKRMGASIKITSYELERSEAKPPRRGRVTSYEPMGDIIVKSSSLKGAVVREKEMPSLIDELPILMVAASLAKGRTVLEGIGELRLKETDRINSTCNNLKKMGADIKVVSRDKSEDVVIKGIKELNGAKVSSFGDHRTAMSMIVAGLAAKGNTFIDDIACIDKSFPDFLRVLRPLLR